MMLPLKDIRVVSLAINVPGPVAAAGLLELGASIVKVEPPTGDPLAEYSPEWYRKLVQGQKVITLNLKEVWQREKFDALLAPSDLLITSMRPQALERLNLTWLQLHKQFTNLSLISIVGYENPRENLSGHDLTYQAKSGLIIPPNLPRALIADLATAEKVVSTALALILGCQRGQAPAFSQISIESVINGFSVPMRYGLTDSNGLLGGASPCYNIYRTAQGWIAVAALEPHFWNKLIKQLGLVEISYEDLQDIFLTRTANEWESWANANDIPISALS
jgi:crotonobetainyl-CoA:carnitine CoA-transferase CaiB-like acyl-CoA transferase